MIKYSVLKDYIINEGFNDYEAKEAIKKLRKMDKELKDLFKLWFVRDIKPNIEIENISFNELIDIMKFNEINAFLVLDWLKREPETAKQALIRPTDINLELSEDIKAKIIDIVKKEEILLDIEDTSDIL